MKLSIPSAVTIRVARTVLKTRKHSPTILFTAGVVGVVATAVATGKATLQLEDVLNEGELKRETAKAGLELKSEHYTEADYKKEMVAINVQNVARVGKLYAPAIILGTLSIVALTGSHKILTSRNAGLTAAYAIIERSLNEYRSRVVEELGEAKDHEFMFGTTERTVVEDTKNGPKKVNIKTFGNGRSPYAKIFSRDSSTSWVPQADYNLIMLKGQQNFATDRLNANGHLFLNEVYDSLGLERTKAGQIVGWVKGNGDNFVDFGIFQDGSYQATQQAINEFMSGPDGAILLDFNVDGNVLDLI